MRETSQITVLRVSILVCALWSNLSGAYELATHAAMTREAFLRSALNFDPITGQYPLLMRIGIDDRIANMGAVYIDMAGNDAKSIRYADPKAGKGFVQKYIDGANGKSAFAPELPSLPAWMMLGAIREDDVPFDKGALDNNPQDDPISNFVRVFNHFYDPYYDRGLGSVPWSEQAPDWAIDGGGSVYGEDNRFSIKKARESMWRAATLKLSNGTTDVPRPIHIEVPNSEALRIAYWATVFRSLGDAVHLLQDMAQPQHTRNDPHAGLGCSVQTNGCLFGHASYYEAYVEARVTKSPAFILRERFWRSGRPEDISEPIFAPPPQFGGYPSGPNSPLGKVRTYVDFYSTGTWTQSLSGTGLANYSNAGFYSAGTNIGEFTHPSPPTSAIALAVKKVPDGQVQNAGGVSVQGSLELLTGSVTDNLMTAVPAEPGVALSARGYFDQFLKSKGKSQYTLNHYNYADQARLLIPRAVAYSAGLIDFFFRGRLEFAPQSAAGVYALVDQTLQGCKDVCGFDKIKLKVRNATPGDTLGIGMLVAVVKFRRNTCYSGDLSGMPGANNFAGYGCRGAEEEIVVSTPEFIPGLDKTDWTPLDFRFTKRIPINASDVQLQVVFRGVLGTEKDAVVVETHDIGEPTFYGFSNISDYVYSGPRKTYDPRPPGSSIDWMDLRIRFGEATDPVVAQIAKLAAQEHAQLAFLAEKRVLFKVTREFWANTKGAVSPDRHELTAAEFVSYPVSQGYESSIAVRLTRGVHRQFHAYLWDPGDTYYDCPSHPEFCAQSTLTPLSPSNRKTFQILF